MSSKFSFYSWAALGLLAVASLSSAQAPAPTPDPDGKTVWYDGAGLLTEGRGWDPAQLASPYDRLPAKAKGVVRQPVWDLSHCSAGLMCHFTTNAPAIKVRWKLTGAGLAMPHMPATGLTWVPADDMLGEDGEGTVDGCHHTDLGMMRQSWVLQGVLRPLVKK